MNKRPPWSTMTVPAFEPGRKWDRSDETEPEPSEWFPWTIHGLRLGREPAGVMDSVLDRRTVLRITDTPGKKSRWPPPRLRGRDGLRPCLKAGMVIFDHAGRFPTLIIPGVFN